MAWISTSVIFYAYSKLYILTELSANDVKFTSVDRQKLDLSKHIYLWYRKIYICRDTARFSEHKKWPSYVHGKAFIVNVNTCLKLFFLEQHINIVNRVALQSVWFICSCLSYTQIKDSSNNHLHTLSTKLIIVRLWPLKHQKLEEFT